MNRFELRGWLFFPLPHKRWRFVPLSSCRKLSRTNTKKLTSLHVSMMIARACACIIYTFFLPGENVCLIKHSIESLPSLPVFHSRTQRTFQKLCMREARYQRIHFRPASAAIHRSKRNKNCKKAHLIHHIFAFLLTPHSHTHRGKLTLLTAVKLRSALSAAFQALSLSWALKACAASVTLQMRVENEADGAVGEGDLFACVWEKEWEKKKKMKVEEANAFCENGS